MHGKKGDKKMTLTEFSQEKYEAMVQNEGMIITLNSLLKKKVITMEQALEECNMTREEFIQEVKDLGCEAP